VIRLTLKLTLFGALLAGIQLAYAHKTGYKDAPSTVREFDLHMTNSVDIVYFGDSTLYRGRPEETHAPTTPQLLGNLLPEKTIGSVVHDAYDPRLIAAFCDHLIRQPHRPEAIIVPINLRAFSPERSRRPEYQFVREILHLRYDSKLFWAFYRPLAAFGLFNLEPITQEDYFATEVYDADSRIGTFEELYARQTEAFDRDMVRALYYYPLDDTHEQLSALKHIAHLCTREGIRPVFYLTPLDYERGNAQLGAEFEQRTAETAQTIANALSARGVEVLDLNHKLSSERFVPVSHPDTYLDQEGKRYVAAELARFIAQEVTEETTH